MPQPNESQKQIHEDKIDPAFEQIPTTESSIRLDPVNWINSFPEEHFGLAIYTQDSSFQAFSGCALATLANDELRVAAEEIAKEALRRGYAEVRSGSTHFMAAKSENHVYLLIIFDQHWQETALKTSILELEADALRRIGKALTMNQTLEPIAMQAAHAICGALDLAAIILWVSNQQNGNLDLIASVGLDREGTLQLRSLNPSDSIECLGHLVAISGSATWVTDVSSNDLTKGIEGSRCFMQPASACAIPLKASHKTIGILEMVAKAGDKHFAHARALHVTIAEHLALALNGALLFESTERMATTDPLTGIANHRSMQEFLHRATIEADADSSTVGLVMVDVDHFRRFNEEEGHECGDEVLRLVAKVLRDSVSDKSMAARYGGEEFTLVVPNTDKEALVKLAEKARLKIENLLITCKSGELRHVTASFGCAIYPKASLTATGALKAADVALYQAKRSGRNKVEFITAEMTKPVAKTREIWEAALANVPTSHSADARKLVAQAEKFIRTLTANYVLEQDDVDNLRGTLVLWEAWQEALVRADANIIQAIQTDEALETVATWLQSAKERWDGNGPQGVKGKEIPLGSRAAAAIVALLTDGTEHSSSDPGRFDPEIFAILTTDAQAA